MSEPFGRSKVFHKLTGSRPSEWCLDQPSRLSKKDRHTRDRYGTDAAIARRGDLRARHEKKRYRFYRLSGSKAIIDKRSMVLILLGTRGW